eukprot:gene10026-3017_t
MENLSIWQTYNQPGSWPGPGFSGYISQCFKHWAPGNISAFATHSTGLFQKGDGLDFPTYLNTCA